MSRKRYLLVHFDGDRDFSVGKSHLPAFDRDQYGRMNADTVYICGLGWRLRWTQWGIHANANLFFYFVLPGCLLQSTLYLLCFVCSTAA